VVRAAEPEARCHDLAAIDPAIWKLKSPPSRRPYGQLPAIGADDRAIVETRSRGCHQSQLGVDGFDLTLTLSGAYIRGL
jgi:hypothetical protein